MQEMLLKITKARSKCEDKLPCFVVIPRELLDAIGITSFCCTVFVGTTDDAKASYLTMEQVDSEKEKLLSKLKTRSLITFGIYSFCLPLEQAECENMAIRIDIMEETAVIRLELRP